MIIAEFLPANIRRALSFVWHSGRALTVANIILTILQGILPLAGLYFMKLLVDAVVAGLSATDKGGAFESLALVIAGLSGIVLLETACASIGRLVTTAQAQVITDRMAELLHS